MQLRSHHGADGSAGMGGRPEAGAAPWPMQQQILADGCEALAAAAAFHPAARNMLACGGSQDWGRQVKRLCRVPIWQQLQPAAERVAAALAAPLRWGYSRK